MCHGVSGLSRASRRISSDHDRSKKPVFEDASEQIAQLSLLFIINGCD